MHLYIDKIIRSDRGYINMVGSSMVSKASLMSTHAKEYITSCSLLNDHIMKCPIIYYFDYRPYSNLGWTTIETNSTART